MHWTPHQKPAQRPLLSPLETPITDWPDVEPSWWFAEDEELPLEPETDQKGAAWLPARSDPAPRPASSSTTTGAENAARTLRLFMPSVLARRPN